MVGAGFAPFYAPIYFVNTGHIAGSLVGLGLAANSLAGTLARIVGGSMSDSPKMGRKKTLIASAILQALSCAIMGLEPNFWWFMAANTFLGFGTGLYWPAGDAMVADITTERNRRDAFAINRFADYCGLGIGILIAGSVIQYPGGYLLLFLAGAASYVTLAATVAVGMREAAHSEKTISLFKAWSQALQDPVLQLYAVANIFMTAYVIQVSSSMPLYLSNVVKVGAGQSLSLWLLSSLIVLHIVILAVSQIPITKLMNRLSSTTSLIASCALWLVGFGLVGLCGLISDAQVIVATLALVLMSFATAAYAPPSSALIAEIAPAESLSIYFSINSLCWALGALLGRPLVLSAMDKFPDHTPYVWLAIALTSLIPAVVFRLLPKAQARSSQPAQ